LENYLARPFTLLVVLFSPLFVFGESCIPSVTGYYNQGTFQRQATELAGPGMQFVFDSLENGKISTPGVSVSSDIDFDGVERGAGNGHFSPDGYEDLTEKYSVAVWSFSRPVYAFGGMWNLSSISAGLQIRADNALYFVPDEIVPQPVSRSGWPDKQWYGFWGFVSATPIESIEISFGDLGTPGSFGQSYCFSDMELLAEVPEPGPFALLGLSVILLGTGSMISRIRLSEV
jgi:hypothetical protein